jgi:hypothetical protein
LTELKQIEGKKAESENQQNGEEEKDFDAPLKREREKKMKS